MAKKYLSKIKKGGNDIFIKDLEMWDKMLIPIDIASLTVSTSFVKNNAVAIDGKIYRCKNATTYPPFPFVFQGDSIVTQTNNGVTAYVVQSDTLNSNWEVYLDLSDRYYAEAKFASVNASITTLQNGKQAAITDNAQIGLGYGTCTTAGGTAAKTATISGFTLKTNGSVSILFTKGFTATSPTLNVNSTGAKPIKYFGEAIAPGKVRENTILNMAYDGTAWNVFSITSLAGTPGMAVDLGLPSGILWCDRNVGATAPEDTGFYFQWGVTEYQDKDTYYYNATNYNDSGANSISADLSLSQDTARALMKLPWRMPSEVECQELIDNCTAEETSLNGVDGCLLTSNINGNSIFFPYSDRIYDRTKGNDNQARCWTTKYLGSTTAQNMCLSSSQGLYIGYRTNGQIVRAVM